MNDLSDILERLTDRVEAIERRVAALEQTPPLAPDLTAPGVKMAEVTAAAPGVPQEAGIFSLLGRTMLAVGGAYLLRALAASSALPHGPVAATAIVYAFVWLVPATRARERFASVAWACTSTLILLPMLWELTLRFRVLTDAVAAAVLVAFMFVASALAWKRNFIEVVTVAEAASGVAAAALALASHDLLPMLSVLLITAVAGEVAAFQHRSLRVRPLIAATADFLVFALLWICASPAPSRAVWPVLSTALILAFPAMLLLIYAVSASSRALLFSRPVSFFEIAQSLVGFLLVVWGVLAFGSPPVIRPFGILCLAGAVFGYGIAFAVFEGASSRRNFHVYASGSLALLLAGAWLSVSAAWHSLLLVLAAEAITLAGVSTGRRTLEVHGLALLAAAAFFSGLPVWTVRALAGPFPAPPGWRICVVSFAGMFSYAAVARSGDVSRGPIRGLSLLYAALALSATAALVLWTLVTVIAGATPAPEHLAVLRTVTGCVVTLLLAWMGSRRRLRELIGLAWISLACLGAKLLLEDLRHGHLGFAAAAIFVYAVTLLMVPRLIRPGRPPMRSA